MNKIYFILIIVSLTLSGCAGMHQRGSVNIAYKAIENNDCRKANKFLTIAEKNKEVTGQLQSKLLFLRAVCLEKEKKYDRALKLYSEIIEQFPNTMYARRSQIRIDHPLSLFSIKVIYREEPVYPKAARNRKIEGWVELDFLIQKDGTVNNIVVIDSEPEELFNKASIKAIEEWRFHPVIINENFVEQKSKQKFMFKLKKTCFFFIIPYSCNL